MQPILNFLSFIFWSVAIVAAVVAFLAFRGYNGLRLLSENVKEAWSNIGVTVRRQASLINQLINVVTSYSEGEKLVMLKVSEDASLGAVQQMHQQSGLVLSAVNGLAQRFPDLTANTQYASLIDSIKEVESQLESQRQGYNAATKAYNVRRTSIPDVFYSKFLGFNEAPYLDFDGASEKDSGTLQQFVTDDGERLNKMLSHAGSKVLEVSQQAGAAALSQGKQIVSVAKSKVDELRAPSEALPAPTTPAIDTGDATVLAGKVVTLRIKDLGSTAAGRSFDIKPQGMTIGRSESADIVVHDTKVSKQHAWLGMVGGTWMLKDQNSSNGTFVGSDISSRITEIALNPDLEFSLGSHGACRFKVIFG